MQLAESTLDRVSTNDFPSLDVRKFWRKARKILKPGLRIALDLSDGSTVPGVVIMEQDPRPGRLVVTLDHVPSFLYLDWTPAGSNGFRIWAKCQQCQGRKAILYVYEKKLRCRDCLKLRYPSQRKHPRSNDCTLTG